LEYIFSNIFEVLEYGSVGVMIKGGISFFNPPILHYSITPRPRLARNSCNLGFTFIFIEVFEGFLLTNS
jgi:hypothetical protein